MDGEQPDSAERQALEKVLEEAADLGELLHRHRDEIDNVLFPRIKAIKHAVLDALGR